MYPLILLTGAGIAVGSLSATVGLGHRNGAVPKQIPPAELPIEYAEGVIPDDNRNGRETVTKITVSLGKGQVGDVLGRITYMASDGRIACETPVGLKEIRRPYRAGQTSTTTQGMGLRATDEANVRGWNKFYSGNPAAAQIPKNSVTYNYRPQTGTDPQAGPAFFSDGNGGFVANSTTRVLKETFVDADNDLVDGTFRIFDAATDQQVGNLPVSPYVPSGQLRRATHRAPPSALLRALA
jgi:hypothetical protein